MSDFKLVKHTVKESSFIENTEKEKKNNMEVGVEGSILVPKNYEKKSHITVKLQFHLGREDERLYFTLVTLTVFEAESIDISESDVQRECIPVALTMLRKTVKKVTEAYGMPALDLPPFEGENI